MTDTFGDSLQGLEVYGHKVVKPEYSFDPSMLTDNGDKLYLSSGCFTSTLYNSQPFNPDMRIQNRLVNLNFAGWRSNTLELQQNGWEISVSEDHNHYRMRIALKHPASGLYGMTAPVDISQARRFEDMQRHTGMDMFVVAMGQQIPIRQPQTVECINMDDFNPVDAVPSVTVEPVKDISDFNIFRPLSKSEQIIIPEQSVSELLGRIQEMQDPKQLEIREKRRKEIRRQLRDCNEKVNSYDLGDNIVAQVATFA
jgi:hypothetical protein